MKKLLLLVLSFSFVLAITAAVMATPEVADADDRALAAPTPPLADDDTPIASPPAPLVFDISPVVIVSAAPRAIDDDHDDKGDAAAPPRPPRRCGAWRPLTQGPGAVRICE